MAKTANFKIKMKDGTEKEVSGTVIDGRWGIDKREDKNFYLTYIPTGTLLTNAKTQKTLKEFVSRPEIIDETDLRNIADLIFKFWSERDWKG